jgi:hypothetical protein
MTKTFTARELHLLKRALAIAVLAIDLQPDGPTKPISDLADMKALIDDIVGSPIESHMYTHAARVVVTGAVGC